MGRAGPLEWVDPTEFKARTKLALSRRSGSTVTMDEAYASYYADRASPAKKQVLYQAMQEYLRAHGGYWNRCERNVVSGGLLQWIYDELAPPSVYRALHGPDIATMDDRAQYLLNAHEVPHSRYGVLYLLGNIKIEPDIFSLVVEGVGAVGATVGSSINLDPSQISSPRPKSPTVFSAMGQNVTRDNLVSGGHGATTVVRTLGGSSGSVTAKPAPAGDPTTYFPCTGRAIDSALSGISETYDQNRYLGVAAGVGAAIIAPVVVTGALIADAGINLARAAKALWDKLMGVLGGLADTVRRKLADRMFVSGAVGSVIKKVVVFAVDMIMKHAVPFLGGAADMANGLIRSIDAVCTRIASWMDRRKIRLVPGHPEEIANSIEGAMEVGIFKGLVDILKGGARTAVSILGPGLGSLASAVMAAIEWLVKVIIRIIESESIKSFLEKARTKFQEERSRAQLQPSPGHELRSDGSIGRPVRGDLAPRIDGTGIISDTDKFTEFFREGCEASPLIPMLTLNSGICGSLMTMVQLFDEDGGGMSVTPGARRQPFDIAGDYFRRLKEYSVQYISSSGFTFSPFDAQDDFIRGLLNHATGKIREDRDASGRVIRSIRSHMPPPTAGNLLRRGFTS